MGHQHAALKRVDDLISGLDVYDQAGVHAAFERIECDSDMRCLLTYLRQLGSTPRRLANSIFEDIAPFYTDSEDFALRRLARIMSRKVSGQDLKDELLRSHEGDLTGVELVSTDGSQFAIFLPDAGEPNRVRVQFFDRKGFFGHSTRDSFSSVFDEAWSSGMRTPTKGNLERLSVTSDFIEGNKITSQIAQFNASKFA